MMWRPVPGRYRWRVALTIMLVVAKSGAGADAAECDTVLEVHGFLRWGANRCSLSRYSPEMVERAHHCFDQLGSTVAAPLMYAGRDRFERLVALRGLQPVCADIVRRFPTVVR